ncbi:hypothetical protein EDC01DRAFT_629291 [Geopyxis carbonaria]|nr:hypothetical protein EDC01DRAFT_629291 [Geopyxis carbonaria]
MSTVSPTTTAVAASPAKAPEFYTQAGPDLAPATAAPAARTSSRVSARLAAAHGAVAPPLSAARRPATTKISKVVKAKITKVSKKKRVCRKPAASDKPKVAAAHKLAAAGNVRKRVRASAAPVAAAGRAKRATKVIERYGHWFSH